MRTEMFVTTAKRDTPYTCWHGQRDGTFASASPLVVGFAGVSGGVFGDHRAGAELFSGPRRRCGAKRRHHRQAATFRGFRPAAGDPVVHHADRTADDVPHSPVLPAG